MEELSRLAIALAAVRQRIDAAARRAGRAPAEVRLMAVTKGFSRDAVLAGLDAGLSLFGENRVQEAEEKYSELAGSYELHLIGHLQRNKARTASGVFRCVQSIDKPQTAEALDARCAERGMVMDVLLELNTSGEPSKSGFLSRQDLLAGLDEISAMSHVRVRGLMTVGPLSDDQGRVRSSFSQLRSLFDEMRAGGGLPFFDTLSMGMSGDFEAAIEEGSTLVRIGTALFGARGNA
ncbi:MAG: YggS family pyridoxal phosphate-dependent enzyme [Spirochaetia bacterium]|jgi:pyridoxal phosphate enzyme (YggS family)